MLKKKWCYISCVLVLLVLVLLGFILIRNQNKEIIIYYTNDVHSYIDNDPEEEGLT